MNELSTSYMQQQKFDKAEPILSEASTALRGTIGEEDPDSLAVAMNLGWTYAELGDFGKAEETTARALSIARRTLGNDHPQTQLGVNNLGVVYNRTGRPELALPLYLEGLEVTRRTLGNDHPDLLPSLSNLAKVHITMKQYDRAMPLLEAAVTKARKLLGKGDFRRGAVLLSYGGCLIGLDRPADAVKALLEAYDSMSPSVPSEHPGLQRLFQLLVEGYSRMGNTRAASEWRAKIVPPKSGAGTTGAPAAQPKPASGS
jgi:tetratricopeptide (TPR) repeat protein